MQLTLLRSLLLLFALAVAACAGRVNPPAAPRRSPSPSTQAVRYIATAYCTGRITASGAPVARGIVAADPRVLPLGSVIQISGVPPYDGRYRVLDTGSAVRDRHVDLYIPDCAAARRFGRRRVRVVVLEIGDKP